MDRITRRNTRSSSSVSHQDLNNNLHQSVEKSSNNLINAHDPAGQRGKNLSQGYYLFFVAMIVVIVTFEVANEVSAITFLPAVLTKTHGLNLDPEHAGYVYSILQFVITAVRFVNIFLSFKVNTVANLYFNFFAMFVGTVILMIFLQSSLLMVEIGIGLLGLGYSSTYPLMITFVEQRISLTNRVSSIMGEFSSLSCPSFFVFGSFLFLFFGHFAQREVPEDRRLTCLLLTSPPE